MLSIRSIVAAVLVSSSLTCMMACSRKQASENPQATQSSTTAIAGKAAGPWQIQLKLSPEKPRMTKPTTFLVHLADQHGQPVTDAQVTGALTMKMMDMGVTTVTFAPQGGGDYEGSVKSLDMSGPWSIAVDASSGNIHVKKDFDVVIFD